MKRIEQVYFMDPKKCENRFQYQKIFLQKYLLQEYLQDGEVYYMQEDNIIHDHCLEKKTFLMLSTVTCLRLSFGKIIHSIVVDELCVQ